MSENEPKPVAWAAVALDASESVGLFRHKQFAEELCSKEGWALVPLYSQPQPILTDAEREAIKLAADFLEDEFYGCSDKCRAEHEAVATLRGLLERTK